MSAKSRPELTLQRLTELLHYNPETGSFFWRVNCRGNTRMGDLAGKINSHGHRQIQIDGRAYYAHRLAWLYVYGEWPRGEIDHINRERDCNRIENLREASRSQNTANTRLSSKNKSGIRGVYRHKRNGKWHASIKINGKKIHLGYFDKSEDAASAYRLAAAANFGEFAQG